MLTTISRHIVYPLMNLRDPFRRLSLTRELERDQWATREDLETRQRQRLETLLRYLRPSRPVLSTAVREGRIQSRLRERARRSDGSPDPH